MSTAAQIEANRQNATLSTGPRTEEGKTASSQNRFQHGFCGCFRVLSCEDVDAYNDLLDSLRAEHKPLTPTEGILVERMAQHHWLGQRAQVLQTFLLNEGPVTLTAHQKEFALYLRYQTSNERAFSKCLRELQTMRAEARKQEIGFERQNERAAAERRRQDAHDVKLKLASARAADAEFDLELKQFVEARLPGHTQIPFSTLKRVLSLSIEQLAAELDADPTSARTFKAA